ncbi:RNA-directed DNA polymerase from mobile element jockey-like [Rhizophagus clarus]|uniref:RNA-directed DNA polymerase from mobile element jockey-like n=1 Tax=Rhizophagus clarus TaxID=94130 RepID=A0A8H3L4H6_9GLOM|nr:RNA-directed DNA polymerase from mobile element jockey-like [Rhizophagus clarus]
MSATPSSTRRTRSATKMSSKTTRTDKQITEETYTPIDIDVITQQNKAKKNRVTADNDADDAFWEPANTKENTTNNVVNSEVPNTNQELPNSTKKSNNNNEEYTNKLPPEPTLQDISKEFSQKNANSLDASIHNSHMTVDQPAPIINEQITDNTDKEINPLTNLKRIFDQPPTVEQLDLNTPNGGKRLKYSSFAIKELFETKNFQQIQKKIRERFSTINGFECIEPEETYNDTKIVKISFSNQSSRDAINGVKKGNDPVIFHTYNKENVDTLTKEFRNNKASHIIRVMHVPKIFKESDIIKIFSVYGEIKSISKTKTNNTSKNRSTRNKKTSSALYDTYFIAFTDARSAKKFFINDIWSIQVEKFLLRILPVDPTNEEYQRRTEFSYKITGLHMDTTFYDIEQITKKIKGQTCYLPPIEINSKRKTRTAYIYVKPEDYQHKIWNVPVGKDRSIYITPSNHSVCSVCGDHSHNVSTCNRYETLEPYLRPNKEQRVELDDNSSFLPNYLRNIKPNNQQSQKNSFTNNNTQSNLTNIQNNRSKNLQGNRNQNRTQNNSTRYNRSRSRSRINTSSSEYIPPRGRSTNKVVTNNSVDNTAINRQYEYQIDNLRKDINLLSKEINTLKTNQEQQEKITEDLHQQIRKFTESQEQMAKQITTTSENIQAINRTQSMILEQIQLLHRPTNNNRQHTRRASPRPHVRSPVPSELSIPDHFLTESEQQGEDPYEDRDENSQSEHLRFNSQSRSPSIIYDDNNGTLNIQSGFNNKKTDILEYFVTNNYDILAIQEMHITTPHLFTNMEKVNVFNNEENINLYIYKDTNGNTVTDSHSGVCLIMKEEFQKRVSTVKTHKGRILAIELYFKKIHLLIINTYIPANNQKKEQIETCYKQIETLINTHSSKPNAHIILLGDFNVQPCNHDRKNNKWKTRIYSILKMASMTNAIKQHHDKYLSTHAPAATKEFTSVIDHIYTTQNIIDHSYYASTATIDPSLHFKTDHKCVFLIIHHDYIFKNPQYHKQNIYRNKNTTRKNMYNYHKMTDELWQQYTEGTKNYLAFHRLEYADTILNPSHTSTIQAIETKWTILKKSILASKAQHIPMYNIKATNRNNTPLPIRQKENMILQIHHALLNFSIKKITHRMAIENEQNRLLVPSSDDPNEITLTRNPKSIEQHSIQHFQLLGSTSKEELIQSIKPYSTLEDIPVKFRPYYAPIQTIDQSQYDCVLDDITNDEILATFKSLPNHKAPGISGITYEDLKHVHPDIIHYTTDFFNLCLRTSSIPRDWKKALLFPIPKPKEWGSDINNTRPIILLETLRKCFIKILTARLHTILSQRHFLQPNNHAGLLGESTYQPLQHLHHAIEMAKKYKKEIWIGVQDLSKAYDRINISLLRLAMARLRISQTIIELILQLFTDRTNRIILHNDNISDPYQVMQGIDQGEVVSPLLWIIYYDPLFARINSLRELAFTVELQQIKNIWNPAADQKVTYSTTVQSYLDDTTWVAPTLTHMKTLLEISNDFYELANIQINKDKYRLLTNNKLYVGKEIELTLGSELTKVKINKKKEGVRILGVYIDAFNSPSPTLKKLRQTVALFSNTLRRKKLTHNHIIYITNKVLMPILEYRNQFQVFTIEQCNFVMAPIKKLFKQSLHLPRSTPDALIHHYLLPSINNFFHNQMYSHIAMTQLLFNTPLLNPIAMTQMLTTQYEFWLPHFPTHEDLTKLESTKLATTFLSKLLIYFNNFNIVFTPVYDITITGGRTPLLFHIPNITKSDITSLQNKRLIFLDQIISGDSSFLLTLPEMKQMAQKNWKGAPPNWLKKMENTEIWTTTNRRLINPPKELPIQNLLIQTPNVLPKKENQLRNQWYTFWDPKSNTSIYGKGIT